MVLVYIRRQINTNVPRYAPLLSATTVHSQHMATRAETLQSSLRHRSLHI